jgi:hypothetical protein
VPSSFTASAISISPVDGVLTIAFLEKPSGEGRFMLLRRDLHASAPDKSGDYLELDGKSRSVRNGIEAVIVHWGRIRFIFNQEGRSRIGVPELTITHDLKLAELGRLFSTISRIFGDSRVRHAAPTIEEVNRLLRVEGDDPDAYGRFDLFVPAFGRTFPVHIEMQDASGIAPATAAVIGDIVAMQSPARKRITQLLYEHALMTAREVEFPDPSFESAPAAPSIVGRLFGRAGKKRIVPLSIDDPIHPCYLEYGIDSVEKKVVWTGFRVNETGQNPSRMCVLDCRPQWEQENGVTIVLRQGVPVGTSDADVNVDDFEARSIA